MHSIQLKKEKIQKSKCTRNSFATDFVRFWEVLSGEERGEREREEKE